MLDTIPVAVNFRLKTCFVFRQQYSEEVILACHWLSTFAHSVYRFPSLYCGRSLLSKEAKDRSTQERWIKTVNGVPLAASHSCRPWKWFYHSSEYIFKIELHAWLRPWITSLNGFKKKSAKLNPSREKSDETKWTGSTERHKHSSVRYWNCSDADQTSATIQYNKQNKNKLHSLSPRANYTDRATAACRRSHCQLLRIKGATWSAWRIPTAVFSVF
jgi:hypothetical protein